MGGTRGLERHPERADRRSVCAVPEGVGQLAHQRGPARRELGSGPPETPRRLCINTNCGQSIREPWADIDGTVPAAELHSAQCCPQLHQPELVEHAIEPRGPRTVGYSRRRHVRREQLGKPPRSRAAVSGLRDHHQRPRTCSHHRGTGIVTRSWRADECAIKVHAGSATPAQISISYRGSMKRLHPVAVRYLFDEIPGQ